jgi:DNA-3-methyladenine glycosylase II
VKASWSTHCVYGSQATGHRSSMPNRSRTSARAASVVVGVMRSTMESGKHTSRSTQSASSGVPQPGEGSERRSGKVTVAPQVVARHDGEPIQTALLAAVQRLGDQAERRPGNRVVWLRQARSYLHHADPVLARLIDDRPDFDPRAWMAQLPPMDLYGALLFQVVGQQLSVAATRRILARIQALFGGHLPSPAELLTEDPGKLREAGLSWRKISTLRDLAGRLEDGRLNPDVLSRLPDNELMAQLTAIPGIGPWTVQGALIIALQREDVVLPGDLALRKAVQLAYQLDHVPSQQEVLAIAEKWRPYRSLATSYLFSAAFEPAGAPPVTSRAT